MINDKEINTIALAISEYLEFFDLIKININVETYNANPINPRSEINYKDWTNFYFF